MGKFNLDAYETVKSRKTRFYTDHKDGRIIAELLNPDSITEYALFKATIYLDAGDTPKATGYAFELRDTQKSTSSYGKEYESVNYTSWTENCEESAVGRALDNAGYASNGKCSRDEIEKAQRMTTTITNKPKIAPDQKCEIHGRMIEAKMGSNGRPYWRCPLGAYNGRTGHFIDDPAKASNDERMPSDMDRGDGTKLVAAE